MTNVQSPVNMVGRLDLWRHRTPLTLCCEFPRFLLKTRTESRDTEEHLDDGSLPQQHLIFELWEQVLQVVFQNKVLHGPPQKVPLPG